MSKIPIKQSYKVTLEDGTRAVVCCGPAILALGSAVVAYETLGEKEEGVYCCHESYDRELAERQMGKVHKKLEEMELYPIRNIRRQI